MFGLAIYRNFIKAMITNTKVFWMDDTLRGWVDI
jgi:hypothetical protein